VHRNEAFFAILDFVASEHLREYVNIKNALQLSKKNLMIVS
jgi:hypothetical protein